MNAYQRTALGLAVTLVPITSSNAIDLVPQEVYPPPPGLTTVQLGYVSSRRGSLYQDGKRQKLKSRVDIERLQLRIGQSFEWLDTPFYTYAQTAYTHTRPKDDLKSFDDVSGVSDLFFLLAAWPYVDPERGRYIGTGVYLGLPTGDYDVSRTVGVNLNPGENRYRAAFQAGYGQRLAERVDWLLVGDVSWFGSNDEYLGNQAVAGTLRQRPIYSGQSSLIYKVHERSSFALSYFYNEGGATRLDSSPWANRIRAHRFGTSVAFDLPFARMVLEYGGDLQTENGFFEDHRWSIKFTTFF